jgi:hypothetical protein
VSRQSVVQDDEPQRTDNPDAASSATPPAADAAVTDPGERIEAPDESKAYYDAQVQSWRQQSAQARERAEKKRAEWEEIRAAERAEVARLKAEASAHGQGGEWENVRSRTLLGKLRRPSTADARHVIAGERSREPSQVSRGNTKIEYSHDDESHLCYSHS